MKKFVALALALTMLLALSACGQKTAPTESSDPQEEVQDQTLDWPKKTIEITIPFSAGGDSDTILRAASTVLAAKLGVNVVVSNVTGANCANGMNAVLNAEKDGYSVFYYNTSLTTGAATGITGDVNLMKDFVNAGAIAKDQSYVAVVRADSGINDLAGLVEYLKVNPKGLRFSTNPNAFMDYMQKNLEDLLGVEFEGVVVGNDNGSRILALLNGEADIVLGNYVNFKDYIADGQLVALGLMANERNTDYPDILTFKEQGFEMVYDKMYAFAFAKGTDQAIIDAFTAALEEVVSDENFIGVVESYSSIPEFVSAEDVTAWEENDIAQTKAYFGIQ